MNVALRGEGVCPVQCDQERVVQHPVVGQAALGVKRVSDLPDQRGDLRGRNRIEDIADLGIRRHVMNPEQRLHIASSGRPLEIPLEGQKRTTLGEEDGEGRAGGVEEGVFGIVPAFSSVRKSAEGGRNPVDKSLGPAGNGIRGGVRNPKGLHALQNA